MLVRWRVILHTIPTLFYMHVFISLLIAGGGGGSNGYTGNPGQTINMATSGAHMCQPDSKGLAYRPNNWYHICVTLTKRGCRLLFASGYRDPTLCVPDYIDLLFGSPWSANKGSMFMFTPSWEERMSPAVCDAPQLGYLSSVEILFLRRKWRRRYWRHLWQWRLPYKLNNHIAGPLHFSPI